MYNVINHLNMKNNISLQEPERIHKDYIIINNRKLDMEKLCNYITIWSQDVSKKNICDLMEPNGKLKKYM